MNHETHKAEPTKFVVALLVSVVIVLVVPILNGGPVIFYDTPSYLEHATKFAGILFPVDSSVGAAALLPESQKAFGSPEADNIVTAGRSLYYGLLIFIGWVTSLWTPAIFQALVLSWLVLLLFKFASPQAWAAKAIVTLAVISIFGSASFFAGLLMPDVWVGMMVLALALLWAYEDRMSIWTKLAMLAIMIYSVVVHASHFAILGAVTVFFAVLWMLKLHRAESPVRKLAMPTIALVCGMIGMVAWTLAVTVGHGAKVMHRPFIAAHLTELGPGTNYLKESCPESSFALCDFKDNLPVYWIDFLFDESPETGVFGAASPEQRLAISEEEVSFALQTLLAEPVATISGLLTHGLMQLWTIEIYDVPVSYTQEKFLVDHAPADVVEFVKSTRLYNSPELAVTIERNTEILAGLSVVMLAALLFLRIRRGTPADSQTVAMDYVIIVLIAGVVLNALICGILASPYGRFQARIIWVLPLVASLILVSQPIALEKPKWLPKLGSS